MDRAFASGAKGRWFESTRAYQSKLTLRRARPLHTFPAGFEVRVDVPAGRCGKAAQSREIRQRYGSMYADGRAGMWSIISILGRARQAFIGHSDESFAFHAECVCLVSEAGTGVKSQHVVAAGDGARRHCDGHQPAAAWNEFTPDFGAAGER